METRQRALYLSHGGGPLPLLGDERHREMVARLRDIAGTIARPAAILVVSAHWEEAVATVTAAAAPSLLYDYYGFPAETYQIGYPAPGAPILAERICAVLQATGIETASDTARGLDHGVFVPLKIMYPEADIPCVELSLLNSLDPAAHLRIGRALRQLDQENLLVIGSGSSFHNMRAFNAPETTAACQQNEAFEQWLLETCSSPALDEAERSRRLIHWEEAPAARHSHPREEHLLPLHVCYGVAGTHCSAAYELRILGKKMSMYLW